MLLDRYERKRGTAGDEQGFVLVGALMILLILVLIGISATSVTMLELQIAGAERVRRETFYRSDAGTELGALVLEENLSCAEGFAIGNLGVGVMADNSAMWRNMWGENGFPDAADAADFLADLRSGAAAPDIRYTAPGGQQEISVAVVGGETQFAVGGALQVAAGYLGKGKGVGSGGGHIVYDLYSQAQGQSGSEALLHVQWRHVIGQEGVCNY
jgi:hypothetical protein